MTIYYFFLAIVIIGFLSCNIEQNNNSTPNKSSEIQVTQNAKVIEKNWDYATEKDMVSGKNEYLAVSTSNNSISLSFPYTGDTYASLILRKHPRYGKDVILKVTQGQLLCSSFEGCSLSVRFDNKSVMRFSATESADYSSDTLFIANYSRFLKSLRNSKKVVIEAPFYQDGNRAFEFNTSKLNF